MTWFEYIEAASYLVTVIGLPLAIVVFVYEQRRERQTQRLWLSWEDYLREWCRRPDFREALPELLQGEDEDFRAHIQNIARHETAQQQAAPSAGLTGGDDEHGAMPANAAPRWEPSEQTKIAATPTLSSP